MSHSRSTAPQFLHVWPQHEVRSYQGLYGMQDRDTFTSLSPTEARKACTDGTAEISSDPGPNFTSLSRNPLLSSFATRGNSRYGTRVLARARNFCSGGLRILAKTGNTYLHSCSSSNAACLR